MKPLAAVNVRASRDKFQSFSPPQEPAPVAAAAPAVELRMAPKPATPAANLTTPAPAAAAVELRTPQKSATPAANPATNRQSRILGKF